MRRFVIVAVAFAICLVSAGVVMALEYTHDWQWIGFDAGPLNSKFGVRLGDLALKYDAEGLTYLKYRATPRQGLVRLLDTEVLIDGKAVWRESEKKAMNIDLSVFESAAKHFQDIVTFEKPVKGFNVEKGQIRWVFLAGEKTYQVTWNLIDNELKTTVVEPQATK
jgi:hypothetical protein